MTDPTQTQTTPPVTETPVTPVTPPVEAPKEGDAEPVTPPAEGEKDAAQLLFGKKDDEPPAEGDKKEGDDADKKDDDKADEGLKFEDFTIDPDMVVQDEVKTELTGIINNKELDEKGKIQGLLDLHQKMMKQQAEGFQGYRKILREASENDPIIGGEKLKASIDAANNAVFNVAKNPKFGGSEDTYNGFVERLTILGLGDDPYVIRFLTNVNKLVELTKDDTLPAGSAGGGAEKAPESILWPNMK